MRVIYFDGVCGLCNRFVDFILKIDRRRRFTFSPLQSDYAKANLPSAYTQDLKSVVYQTEDAVYVRSEAVMRILCDVGGVWRAAGLGGVLPASIRDRAYDLVAENRYKLFGRKETCRLPTPEERSRFVI
jgi:predicted DCC family thiol-disulfide oxidoreductase YuxK